MKPACDTLCTARHFRKASNVLTQNNNTLIQHLCMLSTNAGETLPNRCSYSFPAQALAGPSSHLQKTSGCEFWLEALQWTPTANLRGSSTIHQSLMGSSTIQAFINCSRVFCSPIHQPISTGFIQQPFPRPKPFQTSGDQARGQKG